MSAGIVVLVLIVLGSAAYIPIVRTATRVPGLEREVQRLTDENSQIVTLAAALDSASRRYEQIAMLLGVRTDVTENEIVPGLLVASPIAGRAPSAPSRYETGMSAPTHWPLGVDGRVGFITRGHVVDEAGGELHFGIDVAVAVGTPVRAAGGGRVLDLGVDPEYGMFILLGHPDAYQSMYGHASRLLVTEGEEVRAGQVIALSGNTGRSTAPHLHFEIRQSGQPIDPLSLVKEDQ